MKTAIFSFVKRLHSLKQKATVAFLSASFVLMIFANQGFAVDLDLNMHLSNYSRSYYLAEGSDTFTKILSPNVLSVDLSIYSLGLEDISFHTSHGLRFEPVDTNTLYDLYYAYFSFQEIGDLLDINVGRLFSWDSIGIYFLDGINLAFDSSRLISRDFSIQASISSGLNINQAYANELSFDVSRASDYYLGFTLGATLRKKGMVALDYKMIWDNGQLAEHWLGGNLTYDFELFSLFANAAFSLMGDDNPSDDLLIKPQFRTIYAGIEMPVTETLILRANFGHFTPIFAVTSWFNFFHDVNGVDLIYSRDEAKLSGSYIINEEHTITLSSAILFSGPRIGFEGTATFLSHTFMSIYSGLNLSYETGIVGQIFKAYLSLSRQLSKELELGLQIGYTSYRFITNPSFSFKQGLANPIENFAMLRLIGDVNFTGDLRMQFWIEDSFDLTLYNDLRGYVSFKYNFSYEAPEPDEDTDEPVKDKPVDLFDDSTTDNINMTEPLTDGTPAMNPEKTPEDMLEASEASTEAKSNDNSN